MNCRAVGIVSVLALLAGCSTVERAREAQEEVVAKGVGEIGGSSAVYNLRGRSLAELVDFAQTNRPSVVAARLAVEDARLALKALAADAPVVSATPWTAPKLNFSGGYNESSPGTTHQDMDWRTSGDPSAGLSLSLLLWDFGRYDAKAAAQAERVLAAEQNLLNVGYDVFGDVAEYYFTYHEKCALLEVARANEREYADHLTQATERLQAGEAQQLDVLKARLDYARARQTTVSYSNLVATSGAKLMNALGIDAGHGTCEQVLGPVPASVQSVMRGFARTDFRLDEAYCFARTNAPSMRIARARLRAASGDVDYAVSDLLPKVTASLSLSWANPFWMWSWGVSAAQTLFEGFSRVTAVDRAVVALKTAAATVDEAEQGLSLELEVAIANRDDSVKALETARASLRSSEENLDVVRQQLAVGDATRIDLSEAISAHSTALGSCVSAFYTGQIAEAKLFSIIGRIPRYDESSVKVR